MDDPEKVDTMTPCMDIYKTNIQYDGILDTLKLRIVVRRDFHDTEIIGYTRDPTASMMTLKYFS